MWEYIKKKSVRFHEVVVLDLVALLLFEVGIVRASCSRCVRRFLLLLLFALTGIVAVP